MNYPSHDRIYRAVDSVFRIIVFTLPVLIVVDLTLARGQIPNAVMVVAWVAFLVWVAATNGRSQRERDERIRSEATARGLETVAQDAATLPVGFPLLPSDGRPRSLARTTVHDRDVYVFELEVVEDKRWWDDEPSTYRLAVCLLRLPGDLPRFHIEVGKGHARFRNRWPKPVVLLPGVGACDRLGPPLDAWIRDPRTVEFLAGLRFPCQIRVDRGWLALFSRTQIALWPVMDAAVALSDRIPAGAFLPSEPSGPPVPRYVE